MQVTQKTSDQHEEQGSEEAVCTGHPLRDSLSTPIPETTWLTRANLSKRMKDQFRNMSALCYTKYKYFYCFVNFFLCSIFSKFHSLLYTIFLIFLQGALIPEAVSICKKCIAPKPPRTHHCSICNRCVLKMDHHCRILNITSYGIHIIRGVHK